MALIIFGLLFLLSQLQRRSKAIFYVMVVFLILVFGLNTWTVDRSIYEDRFYNYDSAWMMTITEPGFTMLMDACYKLEMGFQQYMFLSGLLFVASLSFYIRKTARYFTMVLGLYMMAVFSMNVNLLRSSIAFVFAFLAFYIRLDTKYKYKEACFALIVIAGACFHAMCLLYLPYIVVLRMDRKLLIKICIIAIPVMYLSLIALNTYLLNISALIGAAEKVEGFLADTTSDGHPIKVHLLALARLLPVVGLPILTYMFLPKRMKRLITKYDTRFNKILKMNIASLLFMPLLYISHDLYRLQFVFFAINLCLVSRYIRYKQVRLCLYACTVVVGYFYIWRPYFMDCFVKVYMNNLLFGIFS